MQRRVWPATSKDISIPLDAMLEFFESVTDANHTTLVCSLLAMMPR